jgi:hypothetical protein
LDRHVTPKLTPGEWETLVGIADGYHDHEIIGISATKPHRCGSSDDLF